ncbi:acyl transferase [Fulvivirga lutimaris]|uniref:LuxE/PaaK family acyltransferase n=1 Tax=Fulvivirga lutimaris TaxID=1819566 RepID=UPI0012BB9C47|nr:acyl transferase [Fulvivirga lutimaris]MTI39904.1 acyl transferase [Fulvivirga lutimaris]
MNFIKSFEQKLFRIDQHDFDALALELFQYQSNANSVYKRFIQELGINTNQIKKISQIPFLPIQMFKSHKVMCGEWIPEVSFASSGTTGAMASKHHVKKLEFYRNHSLSIFNKFYGSPTQFHFMALLPSYLERNNSSLVYMVDELIKESKSEYSSFYLDDIEALIKNVEKAKKTDKRIFLIGVSFALLDLAGKHELDLSEAIIMETGGMKGRRKEMIRDELHDQLKKAFNVRFIHSEYGMTELMSQAYAKEGGVFFTDNKLRILLRDLNDPFDFAKNDRQGGINVIDLGNYNTCAFIETQDIGRRVGDGFEVLGRFDNSESRGCNLMI